MLHMPRLICLVTAHRWHGDILHRHHGCKRYFLFLSEPLIRVSLSCNYEC
nr:MAG TPA: hypothetical protein [Caudoviricetes sp.]